jgi:hypothetical protein
MRVHLAVAAALAIGLVMAIELAEATVYWTWEDMQRFEAQKGEGTACSTPLWTEEPGKYEYRFYDYFERLTWAAEFLSSLQVDSVGHPDDGGMREAEHMLDVIQTDNTAEAIWFWSHYYRLTGDDRYLPNIEKAWGYVLRYPAYEEEGGSGPIGYYRIYNCGWAMISETEYRHAFGDSTYLWYGDSCASYMVNNPLDIDRPGYIYLNGSVQAWTVGNLYLYGADVDNAAYRDAAVLYGEELKVWVEVDPRSRLGLRYWAMSGGAVMWGITNSYFPVHRDEAPGWIAENAPWLWTYVVSGEFQNAWNAWFALGHYAVWDEIADVDYKRNHHALADSLVADDGDLDGGIPANKIDTDDEDQSWVTSYLGFMCLDLLRIDADLAMLPDTVFVPRGGELGITFAIYNNTDTLQSFFGRAEVFLPNGEPYPGNPVLGPERIVLEGGKKVRKHITHPVPGNAPLGDYIYLTKIGLKSADLIDEESFVFTVTAP